VTVRVYNNSLIEHLAARAADDFRKAGWNVTEVKGYPYGTIPETTAYYRPGTDEEAAAKQLAQAFGFKAEPRFEGIKDASPGVIVIVTKDYGTNAPKGS
jgi:microcystin degradation protein MlrC